MIHEKHTLPVKSHKPNIIQEAENKRQHHHSFIRTREVLRIGTVSTSSAARKTGEAIRCEAKALSPARCLEIEYLLKKSCPAAKEGDHTLSMRKTELHFV